MKIKVLVVDDSALMRRSITEALSHDPLIEVVDIAADGLIALRKIPICKPDVITLDIAMPRLDGLSTLRRIMVLNPASVIIFTGSGSQQNAIRALKYGAIDFVQKPAGTMQENISFLRRHLAEKVKIASKVDLSKVVNLLRYKSSSVANFAHLQRLSHQKIKIIAIGASTGGPVAIEYILSNLPANFPATILIAQHMPKGFTASFASNLDRSSPLRIREAKEADQILPGQVYVAPGGRNMAVTTQKGLKFITLTAESRSSRATPTPSVNTLFNSIATEYGRQALAIVLTGMGRDGAFGMRSIRGRGGFTIAQDKATSVVFGMPKAAVELGKVENVLPLAHIPVVIKKILGLRA